jgi:glucose-1-phosphate cytidylyltransferase
VKCVILAGGRGTRISEESSLRPKPMIEIGGRPILWHIMKHYASHGVTDFVVCLGYRGYVIKEYFFNYFLHAADVTIDLARNRVDYHSTRSEPWTVTLVDTGDATQTGGRVRRIRSYVEDDDAFCLAYGDGVADVDIAAELEFHRAHGRLVTMTVMPPPARWGAAIVDGDAVTGFREKVPTEGGHVNGGYFVVSPAAIDLIEGDDSGWETTPLEKLAASGELAAWRHEGFWQPMDTLREKEHLEALWQSGQAPWRTWE